MRALAELIDEVWYGRHPLAYALAPISTMFGTAVRLRRRAYDTGLLSTYQAPVPVIVVGNLSVGGTGKTPLVIWLVERLREKGLKPGIVARGYQGRARNWPQQVRPDSDVEAVGDEALLLARRTKCPVAVGPNRPQAVAALLEHADIDLIVSDDGLQHYALDRDIEIIVLDGDRRFGNQRCLPAGPLREPISRARFADLVVANGLSSRGEFSMRLTAERAVKLVSPSDSQTLESFAGESVAAIAGIGNPQRFFSLLTRHGLRVNSQPFPDHYRFRTSDLPNDGDQKIFMTEKDAVKCERFADHRCWYVPVTAELPPVFSKRFDLLLEKINDR
ncbi:MAG: tetraacyldisaccharide 4'-kinase [Pseudomonadota bacterium]